VSFDETPIISAENYSTSSNGRMMFPLKHLYNQYTSHVKRIRSRKIHSEINRGFDSDEDNYQRFLVVESWYLPSDTELHTKFVDYKTFSFTTKAANDAVYKRTFYIKKKEGVC
jgi:hypothetical protein